MPAKSKAQQAAAAIALAVKRGEKPKSALKGASKSMSKMTSKQLRDFAKTKTKKLPHKKKTRRESYDELRTLLIEKLGEESTNFLFEHMGPYNPQYRSSYPSLAGNLTKDVEAKIKKLVEYFDANDLAKIVELINNIYDEKLKEEASDKISSETETHTVESFTFDDSGKIIEESGFDFLALLKQIKEDRSKPTWDDLEEIDPKRLKDYQRTHICSCRGPLPPPGEECPECGYKPDYPTHQVEILNDKGLTDYAISSMKADKLKQYANRGAYLEIDPRTGTPDVKYGNSPKVASPTKQHNTLAKAEDIRQEGKNVLENKLCCSINKRVSESTMLSPKREPVAKSGPEPMSEASIGGEKICRICGEKVGVRDSCETQDCPNNKNGVVEPEPEKPVSAEPVKESKMKKFEIITESAKGNYTRRMKRLCEVASGNRILTEAEWKNKIGDDNFTLATKMEVLRPLMEQPMPPDTGEDSMIGPPGFGGNKPTPKAGLEDEVEPDAEEAGEEIEEIEDGIEDETGEEIEDEEVITKGEMTKIFNALKMKADDDAKALIDKALMDEITEEIPEGPPEEGEEEEGEEEEGEEEEGEEEEGEEEEKKGKPFGEGKKKGPGVPDGTGPHGGTKKCQMNK